MSRITPEELEIFLKRLSSEENPLAPLQCGRAKAVLNTTACSRDAAGELTKIANRPPSGLTLYKFGSRSIVGSYTLEDGLPVVLKYYDPSGPHKHLAYGIRGSRCHQSWIAGLAMNHAGISTPVPLVIAEWRLLRGLWLSKSFLATTRASGVSLFQFAECHQDDGVMLQKVASSLHHEFSLMARYRIVHGDLKANNILVSEQGDVSFIDLDAADLLLPPSVWEIRRAKDRKRFFANWKNSPEISRIFRDVFDLP